MACPHCECLETMMICDRECCADCFKPTSDTIRCHTCGVELVADEDTIMKDCDDCHYALVNEGE